MENMKEKEHYIPRFFLKRFADDKELLYVYDVEQDKTYEGNYKAITD